MTLAEITKLFDDHAHKMPAIGKTMKLVFDEGVVFIDLEGENAVISNEDKDANCTITTQIATLEALRKGELNAMMAVMSGKIKIKGDMGVAMQLQTLLKD
ncbi:MAG: SCP2 sterol-binding domain-containing protein [Saprospiraceae bacterium]|nr:SCP2 sterol-binding domain-containing protein [Saprospiraceae bacterium]